MGGDDELGLAELLCARLCHDLAGPVAAVATGAELLGEEAESGSSGPGGSGALQGGGEAFDLLATSAVAAIGRLRFLRQAFGGGTSQISGAQLRKLAEDFLATSGGGEPTSLAWADGSKTSWDSLPARLLLNMILLGRDSLPRGGSLVVRSRHGGEPLIQVMAEGKSAAPAEAAKAVDAPDTSGLGPRGAQGYLSARLAAGLGLSLGIEAGPGQVLFVTRQK